MPANSRKGSSYPLRLPLTMRRELEALAKREGISINHLISLAVAEKIVRYQQQAIPDHDDARNSPTLHEPNGRQRSETNPLAFGASLQMEPAQRHENSVGLPIYPHVDKKAARFDWIPTKTPTREHH